MTERAGSRPIRLTSHVLPVCLFASLFCLLSCAYLEPEPQPGEEPRPAPSRLIEDPSFDSPLPAHLIRGKRIYDHQCSVCHGFDGRGSAVSYFLSPPPRDFRFGLFHLVSTENGVPTDDDLLQSIRRGMPGSSMPGFGWMQDSELEDVVRYVRHLNVQGIASFIHDQKFQNGESISVEGALVEARKQTVPGAIVSTSAPADPSVDTLNLGRTLYVAQCAACHGEDGKGRGVPGDWRLKHDFNQARDFTAGILRGGASPEALSHRIHAGMPGAGMPPTRFDSTDQSAALLYYLETLMPEGVGTRLLHKRNQISVVRVPRAPGTASDSAWDEVETTRVVLAPLVWKDDAIFAASLAFVHDGTHLAVRVRWADPTEDSRPFGNAPSGDGLALQFTGESNPPLFGMGSSEFPVSIWHWKSFDFHDVAGLLDIMERRPHRISGGVSDISPYQPAFDPRTGKVKSMVSTGPNSLPMTLREEARVESSAVWNDGEWSVVLRRNLIDDGSKEISFAPGGSCLVALAIWNGSAGEKGQEKSISIWQELQVQ